MPDIHNFALLPTAIMANIKKSAVLAPYFATIPDECFVKMMVSMFSTVLAHTPNEIRRLRGIHSHIHLTREICDEWIRVVEMSIADVDGILNHIEVMTRMREIVGHMLTTSMTRSASRILTTIIDKHSRGEDIDDDLSEALNVVRI
jgi:hypothetical protein